MLIYLQNRAVVDTESRLKVHIHRELYEKDLYQFLAVSLLLPSGEWMELARQESGIVIGDPNYRTLKRADLDYIAFDLIEQVYHNWLAGKQEGFDLALLVERKLAPYLKARDDDMADYPNESCLEDPHTEPSCQGRRP